MTNHDNTRLASCKQKDALFVILCHRKTSAQRSKVSKAGSMEWKMNVKLNNRFFCGYSFRMWLRAGDLRSLNNKEITNKFLLPLTAVFLQFLSLLWDLVSLKASIWLHGENKCVRNVSWEANQWYIMYDFTMPVSSISKALYKLTGNHVMFGEISTIRSSFSSHSKVMTSCRYYM